jgi:hypothetical protein
VDVVFVVVIVVVTVDTPVLEGVVDGVVVCELVTVVVGFGQSVLEGSLTMDAKTAFNACTLSSQFDAAVRNPDDVQPSCSAASPHTRTTLFSVSTADLHPCLDLKDTNLVAEHVNSGVAKTLPQF